MLFNCRQTDHYRPLKLTSDFMGIMKFYVFVSVLNAHLCPLPVAALWSHPQELPELPHQNQDRNYFIIRYHHGKQYTAILSVTFGYS